MLKAISSWLRPRKRDHGSISIPVPAEHKMVKFAEAMDWEKVIVIAQERRAAVRKYLSGPTPNYRENIGAMMVRSLESCTFRKAEDLIRNYAPARYLCGLASSTWTPNFRTQCDFEIMLGAEGLAAISTLFLLVAQQLGFADVKGLCSDTTAQEAQIPYPTEVGLMGSFAKSIRESLETLGRAGAGVRKRASTIAEMIGSLVRRYRLFAKTKAESQEVESELLKNTKRLVKTLTSGLSGRSSKVKKGLRGQAKTAFCRLSNVTATMKDLIPQMAHYFEKRKPVSGKIVSLFLDGVHSIVRGKAGKKVEFGLKWGVNQIRGGYVALFLMSKARCDADHAVEAVKQHQRTFGEVPREFGFDRAGWSEAHIKKITKLGVKRIAIAPKGRAAWLISERCKKRMVNERAQVEGKIGTLKSYGLNKPHAKTTAGMVRSAHRAEIRFNVTKLLKDCARASAKGERKGG